MPQLSMVLFSIEYTFPQNRVSFSSYLSTTVHVISKASSSLRESSLRLSFLAWLDYLQSNHLGQEDNYTPDELLKMNLGKCRDIE